MLQRRREIGIRMALGAPPRDLAGLVTARNFLMVLAGAAAGLGPGIVSDHYLEPLLFRVRSTELPTLITPALAIFGASCLAARACCGWIRESSAGEKRQRRAFAGE